MAFDTDKLHTMFNRVMENSVQEGDEAKASAYLKKVFGGGYPSQHELHQFNEVVVRQAEVIFQKKATDVFKMLADFVTTPNVEVYQYQIPTQHKAKWVWTANGTSVEAVRIGTEQSRIMTPTKISTGAYYEVGTLAKGDVEYYKEIVNKVADAKIDMYFQKVSELLQAAVADARIPQANILTGTNLTLNQYNQLVSTFARFGGRPVFVGDVSIIDHFAFQQTTDNTFKELLFDELKRSLVEDLNIAKIGRSTAVNMVNPFIVGSGNTKTVLPRNEGYMFASGAGKPMKLVEFGAMKQYTEFDSDLEQVQIKITQFYALDFVQGELIGYVQDDSIEA